MNSAWHTFRDVALASATALALYASGFLVIFTPLPLFYAYVLRGRGTGLVSILFSTLIVFSVYALILFRLPPASAEPQIALFLSGAAIAKLLSKEALFAIGTGYFLFFSVIALLLGEGAKRKFGLLAWGISTAGGGLIVAAALIAWFFLFSGEGTLQGIQHFLTSMAGEAIRIQASAAPDAQVTSFLTDRTPDIARALLRLAPSIIFIFTLLCAVLNMLIGRRIIKKRHAFAHLQNVARFKLPDGAVWAVIFFGLAFLGDARLLHAGWLSDVALNGLLCAGALYFFQGLAVIVYFLQGVRLPFIRLSAYAMIVLFFHTMGILIVAIGIADVWANFRLRSWRARHGQGT